MIKRYSLSELSAKMKAFEAKKRAEVELEKAIDRGICQRNEEEQTFGAYTPWFLNSGEQDDLPF